MCSQVRRLEAQELTPKQAEAITAVITEVLNDSLENVAQSFTSKTEMTRVCARIFVSKCLQICIEVRDIYVDIVHDKLDDVS